MVIESFGIYCEFHALGAHRRAEYGIDLVEHDGDIEGLCVYLVLAAFDLAHIHNVIEQAQKILRGLVDLVEIVAQFLFVPLADHFARKVCKPRDGVHGRAYLVRHVRKELALCAA